MTRYQFQRNRIASLDDIPPPTDDEGNHRMTRLRAAGLTRAAAEKVAQHPRGGPVVLGPGIVVSLFPLREDEHHG